MATKTETLIKELRINYLTEAQFKEALTNDEINDDEVYMTPENDELKAQLDEHIADTSNPHNVSLSNLGITATADELNYCEDVTSNIQEQLDGKALEGHAHDEYMTVENPTGTGAFSMNRLADSTVGDYSSTLGNYCSATGKYSSAIGGNAHATGMCSHAEGGSINVTTYEAFESGTVASGNYSHAEGAATTASGIGSHSEGSHTVASGHHSHSEGLYTTSGSDVEVETYDGYSNGQVTHAEGLGTVAYGLASHSEGISTKASGQGSHAEGELTIALGKNSHVEGYKTTATGSSSITPDTSQSTTGTGIGCHAEGEYTVAYGGASHAEGYATYSSGNYGSHAEGRYTVASGTSSHAEGRNTTASGMYSHAEGYATSATGASSHAEGYNTVSGSRSHAEGFYATANDYQHAQGHYNNADNATAGTSYGTTGTAFVIGNGTSSTASNACRITYAGGVIGKAAYASTGADYAEYFEWVDGNTDNEDRVGYFVTFEDGRFIRKANEDDYILGIVSGNPCVLGNHDECWMGQNKMDEWGRFIYVTETHIDELTGETTEYQTYKVNPDYDNSVQYVPRSERPEWSAIGMIGVLSVRDDGTCLVNGYCKVTDGGIATLSETRENAYRVIERVTDNIIKIVFR